jgi:hypothetical protein
VPCLRSINIEDSRLSAILEEVCIEAEKLRTCHRSPSSPQRQINQDKDFPIVVATGIWHTTSYGKHFSYKSTHRALPRVDLVGSAPLLARAILFQTAVQVIIFQLTYNQISLMKLREVIDVMVMPNSFRNVDFSHKGIYTLSFRVHSKVLKSGRSETPKVECAYPMLINQKNALPAY